MSVGSGDESGDVTESGTGTGTATETATATGTGTGTQADLDEEQRLEDVCRQAGLQLESETAKVALSNLRHARNHCTLEGDIVHWLGCSIFVASNKTTTDDSTGIVLARLLTSCKISINDFFVKIKRWNQMLLMPQEFKVKVELLESKFAISTLLFEDFKRLFSLIFSEFDKEDLVKSKLKKSRKLCNPRNLFDFCWYFIICVKGERPECSSDIVHANHMLLACLDLVYANACVGLKRDLINQKFEGPLPEWSSIKTETTDLPCIIDVCLKNKKDQIVYAKSIKQYAFKDTLINFINKGFLKADSEKFTGLLDASNFEFNLKSLNTLYETYILKAGEYDERIFLDKNEQLCMPKIREELEKNPPRVHDTPLTGRQHLLESNRQLTPGSLATDNVCKLYAYLDGCYNAPSNNFIELVERDSEVLDYIIQSQKEWGVNFLALYSYKCTEAAAAKELNLTEALFYRLLESIMVLEQKKKGLVNFRGFMSDECYFLPALFACCAEIVIYAEGTHGTTFPWILEAMELSAFDFVKIIELVVLVVRERLSRDMVKHLNMIEEQVLQQGVWTSNSPIWARIEDFQGNIPSYRDVSSKEPKGPDPPNPIAPTSQMGVPASPVVSPSDVFLSPNNDVVKKQLFNDSTIKPGQSLLNLNKDLSEETLDTGAGTSKNSEVTRSLRPIKGSSTKLFLRKFYYLGYTRMLDLCKKLSLNDQELKQKIWTCFEYCIVKQIHLLKNRHLDQILMCVVYVICKVNKQKVEFTDIMKCYRSQPQATSDVYRRVLVPREQGDDPGNLGAEKEGDLIEFYNKVFVPFLEQYVSRFIENESNQPIELREMPSLLWKNGNGSNESYRVSEHLNLYVRPLTESSLPNHHQQYGYSFTRSSNNDFREINRLMINEPLQTFKRKISLCAEDAFLKKIRVQDSSEDNDEGSAGYPKK